MTADPTEGLTKAMRLAICDASYGLLGEIDGHWQRQTVAYFGHSPATIEALAERGLVAFLRTDIVQATYRGKRLANRLRQRRATIARWEMKGRLGGRPRLNEGQGQCATQH